MSARPRAICWQFFLQSAIPNKLSTLGKEGKGAPVLIPELFEASKRIGRRLRVGGDAIYTNLGELPESPGISWEGVHPRLGNRASSECLAPGVLAVVQERVMTLAALRESWHSWLEQQSAEKEEKAMQSSLA